MTAMERPNIEPILNGLKDFQRNSVEHAFRRLYMEPNTSGRFLVADEVGLGKTMVAKGLIARAIDHLWDEEERIDILYICSNGDIARQNIQRLQLDRSEDSKFAFATRSTLLPVTVKELQKNKVNYISLTPGTSFDMKSSLGMGEERLLLYWLLKDAWDLEGTAAINLLQGDVGMDNFRLRIREYDRSRIDTGLQEAFLNGLEETDLRNRFEELMQEFRYGRERNHVKQELRILQNELIGELRSQLAITSLSALSPDLIIMDEFQRFKHLFNADTEAGELAGNLFRHTELKTGAKILLLSATPYKMYTLHNEADSDDHYRDFIGTLRFLLKDESKTEEIRVMLDAFRKEMYRVDEPDSLQNIRDLKERLEHEFRNVIVRTERLAATEDRNGMLVQVLPQMPALQSSDVSDYVALQSIARSLEETDVLEYWKTAPYLLNFMDDYKFKTRFMEAVSDPLKQGQLVKIMEKHADMFLSQSEYESYGKIDLRNMRLRGFMNDYMNQDVWKLLWLPPSMPYYQMSGCFDEVKGFTKRLIFSSWRVVPKVLSTYLSYEAERQMLRLFDDNAENTQEARVRRRGLLQFAYTDNRLTGMPILTLLYPSETLVRRIDPLNQFIYNNNDEPPTLSAILKEAETELEPLIRVLSGYEEKDTAEDEAWYWAAPILLDLKYYSKKTEDWWSRTDLASVWRRGGNDDEDTHWGEHVEKVRELLRGEIRLGRQPADLVSILAYVAIGSPAVTAYRSLLRQIPESEISVSTEKDGIVKEYIRDTAAQMGWSFRSLYNVPEVTALIRGLKRDSAEPYWHNTLEYGADGCLQAMIDEYVHYLIEGWGELNEKSAEDLSIRFSDVLTLRTSTMAVDKIKVENGRIDIKRNDIRMRARFATRFGNEQSESGQNTRASQVRDAFNSPFWPFILTTTSVGQEGLDFHPYCHAIVHWDLPSNPVDLEQREGRVHRYKGHAVRRNIAKALGPAYRKSQRYENCKQPRDPWGKLFKLAQEGRVEGESDLVPFWLYPLEEGAKIERHVTAHGLSKDFVKLTNLRRSLAVYRMVFGQPRQEDLIQFLMERLNDELASETIKELRINLSPIENRITVPI